MCLQVNPTALVYSQRIKICARSCSTNQLLRTDSGSPNRHQDCQTPHAQTDDCGRKEEPFYEDMGRKKRCVDGGEEEEVLRAALVN